jgi:hypothetical protein
VGTGLVAPEDFLFAPVKGYERSVVKLLDYTRDRKNALSGKGSRALASSLYDLKDLLRGSVITDSPKQTSAIFQALASLKNAQVVQVKNGFADKTKDGRTTPYDPAE